MSGYIGTQPVPQATQTRDSFTCTAGQTSFATGGYTPTFLDVYLNGIFLANGADYTAGNGSDVILTAGAAAGDILEVVAYTTFEAAHVTGADDFTVTGSFTSQGIDDNATSTAMTLDASGNLLVGQPSLNYNDIGGSISAGGTLGLCADSYHAATFNRKTSDGDIAVFYKDGSTVGSIGTRLGRLYLHSPHGSGTGIRLGDSWVQPSASNGSDNDAVTSLGYSGSRFKDLYLSGGVYLGGTGAANKLDDYEFGSWTPTLARSVSNPTVTYTTRGGYYYKVGNVVFVRANIVVSSVSGGSGGPEITGLPFTPNHTYSYGFSNHGCSTMSYGLVSTTGSYPPVMFARGDSSSRITVVDSDAGGLTGWNASGRLDFALTYTTNS